MVSLKEAMEKSTLRVAVVCGRDPELGGSNEVYLPVLEDFIGDIIRRDPSRDKINVFISAFGQPYDLIDPGPYTAQPDKVDGLKSVIESFSEEISDTLNKKLRIEAFTMTLDHTRFINDSSYREKRIGQFRRYVELADIPHLCGGCPITLAHSLNQLNALEILKSSKYIIGFSAGGSNETNEFLYYEDEPSRVHLLESYIRLRVANNFSMYPIGDNGENGTIFITPGALGYIRDCYYLFHGNTILRDGKKRWASDRVKVVSKSLHESRKESHVLVLENVCGTISYFGDFGYSRPFRVVGRDAVFHSFNGSDPTPLSTGKIYNLPQNGK